MSQFRRELRIWILATLGALVLRFIARSITWERLGNASNPDTVLGPDPVIFAFWHRKQLMMGEIYKNALNQRGKGAYILSSQHPDGQIIGRSVQPLGIKIISGSSSRGGRRALRSMYQKLKEGWDIAITPDGPRGPPFKCKPGIFFLAKMSGAKILPCSFAVSRSWQVKSWDRMVVPKPFSKGVLYIGEPLVIPSDATREQEDTFLASIDEALNNVERMAEEHFQRRHVAVTA